MIPAVVGRLALFSAIAFISVYFAFMMGMPIGIELPAYILRHHDPPIPRKVLRFYRDQVKERQYWLKRILRTSSDEDSYQQLYSVLAPEVHCPQLVRVGFLDGKCTILSLGLGSNVTFEKELQKMTNSRCRILGYDSNNPSNLTRDEFWEMHGKAEQATLAATTDKARGLYTVADLVEIKGIGPVEILKAGTNTTDYLLPYLEEAPVSQLLLELEMSTRRMFRVLASISEQGYFLVTHDVLEKDHAKFTLIHEAAFKKYGVKILARYLDFANRAD